MMSSAVTEKSLTTNLGGESIVVCPWPYIVNKEIEYNQLHYKKEKKTNFNAYIDTQYATVRIS